jgi:hypothetical protein
VQALQGRSVWPIVARASDPWLFRPYKGLTCLVGVGFKKTVTPEHGRGTAYKAWFNPLVLCAYSSRFLRKRSAGVCTTILPNNFCHSTVTVCPDSRGSLLVPLLLLRPNCITQGEAIMDQPVPGPPMQEDATVSSATTNQPPLLVPVKQNELPLMARPILCLSVPPRQVLHRC